MKPLLPPFCALLTVLALALASTNPATAQAQSGAAVAPYPAWQHSGVLTILTTPEGADLPVGTVTEGFPLLVRLHKDWFDFKQAKADAVSESSGKAVFNESNGYLSVWHLGDTVQDEVGTYDAKSATNFIKGTGVLKN